MQTNINISIMGKQLHLNRTEVQSCKEIVCQFIDNARNAAKTSMSPTYYFTLLIVMHHLSQELLADMDKDSIELIFNRLEVKNNTSLGGKHEKNS